MSKLFIFNYVTFFNAPFLQNIGCYLLTNTKYCVSLQA
nr:MAG TPA: Interferon alpha/beta receptor [Caudoviricetes sp.]